MAGCPSYLPRENGGRKSWGVGVERGGIVRTPNDQDYLSIDVGI